MKTQLIEKKEITQGKLIHSLFVPGRVNLIGDHTDYNNGLVLPCAIHLGINFRYFKVPSETNKDLTIFLSSEDEETAVQISNNTTSENETKDTPDWVKYAEGSVHKYFSASKAKPSGIFHFHATSTLPRGAGLSSSAALCVGLITALGQAFNSTLDLFETARLAMEVEHEYAGTKCGLMDQLVILAATKDHFLEIDFGGKNFFCPAMSQVPINSQFAPYKLVIFNTNVKHSLAASAYNVRRQESHDALQLLSSNPKMTLETFEGGEVLKKRAKHVLGENERVRKASVALSQGDFESLHSAMRRSHDSLKELYEVSCSELDTACETALQFASSESPIVFPIIGPRMTGGGFGGSTVQLVHETIVEKFVNHFSQKNNLYTQKTGLLPTLIVTSPQAGVWSRENL